MSFRKSIERVASIYLENKGFFPPELIGAESDGALLYESDEEYMKPNFSAQIFRELSDRQVAGELSDGQIIDAQREPQDGRKGDRIANLSTKFVTKEEIKRNLMILDLVEKTLEENSGVKDDMIVLSLIENIRRSYKSGKSVYKDILKDFPYIKEFISGLGTSAYRNFMFGYKTIMRKYANGKLAQKVALKHLKK